MSQCKCEAKPQEKSMKQHSQVSRRRFLQRTAALAGVAAGAQYLGMPSLLGADSPNAKLGVAVIGADGMGGYSFDCAHGGAVCGGL